MTDDKQQLKDLLRRGRSGEIPAAVAQDAALTPMSADEAKTSLRELAATAKSKADDAKRSAKEHAARLADRRASKVTTRAADSEDSLIAREQRRYLKRPKVLFAVGALGVLIVGGLGAFIWMHLAISSKPVAAPVQQGPAVPVAAQAVAAAAASTLISPVMQAPAEQAIVARAPAPVAPAPTAVSPAPPAPASATLGAAAAAPIPAPHPHAAPAKHPASDWQDKADAQMDAYLKSH